MEKHKLKDMYFHQCDLKEIEGRLSLGHANATHKLDHKHADPKKKRARFKKNFSKDPNMGSTSGATSVNSMLEDSHESDADSFGTDISGDEVMVVEEKDGKKVYKMEQIGIDKKHKEI